MIYISLGWNCGPAILRKNIFKYSKNNGYKTCPFDLCVTPYKSLLECLTTKFTKFFNLRIENGIIMNEYDMWFNHESPSDLYINNNFEKFIDRYTNRINNFKKYLNGNDFVYFIHSDPFHSSDEVYLVIKNIYPNLNFKILSLHNTDIDVYINHFSSNSDCRTHSEIGKSINFQNKIFKDTEFILNCNINENNILFLNKYVDFNIFKNEYGNYYVPKGMEKGIDWVLKNGFVHEKETLNFIKSNIYNNGSIVTAGTHIGTFLPFYSKIADKVLGFEPITENYHYSILNIELNSLKNVNIRNVAIGNFNGEVNMIENNLIEKSLCRIIDNNTENTIKVKCITLDSVEELNESNISIIQLDVEGYENFVLYGSENLIKKNKPLLILENNNVTYEIPKFLEEMSYKQYEKKINENIILYIPEKHYLKI